MQFTLPLLLVFASLALTTTVAASSTFETAEDPRDALSVETVQPPPDADSVTVTSVPYLTQSSIPPFPSDSTSSSAAPPELEAYKFASLSVCKVMRQQTLDDVVFACERFEGLRGRSYVFFRRDNSYLLECRCRDGLETAFPIWDARWNQDSSPNNVTVCFARKGERGVTANWWRIVTSKLNTIKCGERTEYCDTRPVLMKLCGSTCYPPTSPAIPCPEDGIRRPDVNPLKGV